MNPHYPEALARFTPIATETSMRLQGRTLLVARVVWICLTLFTLALFVANIPPVYKELYNVCRVGEPFCDEGPLSAESVRALSQLGLSLDFYAAYWIGIECVFVAITSTLGLILFLYRSDDWLALLTAFATITAGPNFTTLIKVLTRSHTEWYALIEGVLTLGLCANILFLFYFPNGQFVPRWMRLFVGVWIVGLLVQSLFPDSPYALDNWPPLLRDGYAIGAWGSAIAAQVYRYFRVSNVLQRRQTEWLLFGIIISYAVYFIYRTLPTVFPSLHQIASQRLLYHLLGRPILSYGSTIFGLVFLMIAILRYRLWNIDIIINRTLVYGTLTATVVGLYLLIVEFLSALFRVSSSPLLSALTTAFVAIIFQPVRQRLQRGVNRLMYGNRDDPYSVLSRLGQELKTAPTPEALLSLIAKTVAQTLKLPYVALAFKTPSQAGMETLAAHGQPTANLLRLPIIYQAETIGELRLAPRAPDEALTPNEQRLLADLAQHAGVAAHAARLTADLQDVRESLVITREEERRTLRRNLHDRVGPALASLRLKVEAARNLLEREPATTDKLLAEVSTQSNLIAEEVQSAIYLLRPPALDQLGLLGALRNHPLVSGGPTAHLEISIEGPEPLPVLPAAIEVAAYHIVLEALNNTVRHARANLCRVVLSFVAGQTPGPKAGLHLEIWDDGIGLPAAYRSGVGILSMRERAEELGGTCQIKARSDGPGTRLVADLPFPKV